MKILKFLVSLLCIIVCTLFKYETDIDLKKIDLGATSSKVSILTQSTLQLGSMCQVVIKKENNLFIQTRKKC